MKRFILVVGCIALGFGCLGTVPDAGAANRRCRDAVLPKEPLNVPLTRFWRGETLATDFARIADLNAVMVWEVADFFKTKKRLPFETELPAKLKKHVSATPAESENLLLSTIDDPRSYFTLPRAAESVVNLLKIAIVELADQFNPLKDAAAKVVMASFKQKLRPPAPSEIAEKLKMSEADLRLILENPADFWEESRKRYPAAYIEARAKLVKAFIRAMQQRDLPDHQKTQSHTPTVEEIYVALLHSESNRAIAADTLNGDFDLADLRVLLNLKEAKPGKDFFTSPVLYEGGIAQLEEEAKISSPGLFRNFISGGTYTPERAEAALNAVKEKSGFLVTSVTAGVPIDEKQYALMLRMAEDLDYDVLIMPTNQVLEGIDPRLLENPRVHVITHSIENRFLKIWQLPIMPKNQNPFASLDQRGQFKPGQTVIVGHPQLAHRIVPTGSNHIQETSQWSVGTLTQALYPYRLPVQGRTSGLAKNYHRNGFLVVQKADAKAGLMGEGVQNLWHVRPVEYADDTAFGKEAGFTDLGVRYAFKNASDGSGYVQVSREEPVALVVGDLHDWVTDQRMLLSYRALVLRFSGLRDIYIHDPIDGFSHNHHEAERFSLLMKKFKDGTLDYHREMMGLVQTTNAFLTMRPNLRVIFADSNHSYWGRRLIDSQPTSQLVVNGSFLAELTHARRILGVEDPLEYVFQDRNRYIESLPLPVKMEFHGRAIPVVDPLRVQVLPFGQPHVVGPEYRPVHLNHHGHQGPNGAKGSVRSHAIGNENAIVGDSHQSAMWGGLINVGTTTPKRIGYNEGGYSAWNNSFALVYADGTKQLVTYSSLAGTFEPRPEVEPLPPHQFFGDSPLETVPTDNELLPGVNVMDAHSSWVELFKK